MVYHSFDYNKVRLGFSALETSIKNEKAPNMFSWNPRLTYWIPIPYDLEHKTIA